MNNGTANRLRSRTIEANGPRVANAVMAPVTTHAANLQWGVPSQLNHPHRSAFEARNPTTRGPQLPIAELESIHHLEPLRPTSTLYCEASLLTGP
ncbi:hypothetical protein NEUTE2DRAFT_68838 [Neurospora tetrasperma FGSC 2509]|nr:hypothetical protein NEUTE2DRAFT_68838 [Neurospora tetrasperma FGSC 2509]